MRLKLCPIGTRPLAGRSLAAQRGAWGGMAQADKNKLSQKNAKGLAFFPYKDIALYKCKPRSYPCLRGNFLPLLPPSPWGATRLSPRLDQHFARHHRLDRADSVLGCSQTALQIQENPLEAWNAFTPRLWAVHGPCIHASRSILGRTARQLKQSAAANGIPALSLADSRTSPSKCQSIPSAASFHRMQRSCSGA